MVKTRLIEQIGQANRLYSGPIDCARQIIARDGFKGLYRGLKVNFIGVMPEKAIKLAVNDACRNHFLQANNGAPVTIAQGGCSARAVLQQRQSHLWAGVMSGGIAGFTQCVATNPMEVTKMFYQASGSNRTAILLPNVLADVEHQAPQHPCSFHQRCREKSLGRRRGLVPRGVQHAAARHTLQHDVFFHARRDSGSRCPARIVYIYIYIYIPAPALKSLATFASSGKIQEFRRVRSVSVHYAFWPHQRRHCSLFVHSL